MSQTGAIFYDAYRDLRARRLFSITLILSAVAIGGFGLLGVSDGQLKFLKFHLPTWPLDAHGMYLYLFSKVVVGLWLTWIAIMLALISTAGIFPDLLAGGTIELYLARPMGRLRFFLNKYISGLLFAALQVGVFTVGAFFVLGLRGGVWNPALFLAIPLVVCAFSYLFAVSVFFGVCLRSTIGALLITLVIGGIYTGLFWSDQNIFDRAFEEGTASKLDRPDPSGDNTGYEIRHFIREALVPLPKIFPTTRLLDRFLKKKSDILIELDPDTSRENRQSFRMWSPAGPTDADREEAYLRATGGDLAYTLGSSLAFEAVLVGLAAWIFCRRDY